MTVQQWRLLQTSFQFGFTAVERRCVHRWRHRRGHPPRPHQHIYNTSTNKTISKISHIVLTLSVNDLNARLLLDSDLTLLQITLFRDRIVLNNIIILCYLLTKSVYFLGDGTHYVFDMLGNTQSLVTLFFFFFSLIKTMANKKGKRKARLGYYFRTGCFE